MEETREQYESTANKLTESQQSLAKTRDELIAVKTKHDNLELELASLRSHTNEKERSHSETVTSLQSKVAEEKSSYQGKLQAMEL